MPQQTHTKRKRERQRDSGQIKGRRRRSEKLRELCNYVIHYIEPHVMQIGERSETERTQRYKPFMFEWKKKCAMYWYVIGVWALVLPESVDMRAFVCMYVCACVSLCVCKSISHCIFHIICWWSRSTLFYCCFLFLFFFHRVFPPSFQVHILYACILAYNQP